MVDLLNNDYGFVYAIQSLDLIKVGVAKNIAKRINAMRLDNPHGCELLFYRRTYAPYTFEAEMHRLLAEKAVGREWFRVSLADVRIASKTARLASWRRMIIVAVNTCGGFKAEIAYDPTAQPFDEPFRHIDP